MYNLVPVFHNDGLDVRYHLHFKSVINTLEASVGQLEIPQPGFEPDGHVNLLSASIDFVF